MNGAQRSAIYDLPSAICDLPNNCHEKVWCQNKMTPVIHMMQQKSQRYQLVALFLSILFIHNLQPSLGSGLSKKRAVCFLSRNPFHNRSKPHFHDNAERHVLPKELHPPIFTVATTTKQLFRRVSRGGGFRSRTVISQTKDVNNGVKRVHQALASMKYTYRMCFLAVAADLITTLIDDNVTWRKPFTWLVAVDILNSLNLVVFGVGLWKVTNLYVPLVSNHKKQLDFVSIREICKTMARVWRFTAWTMVGLSMSLAATFREHAGWSRGPGKFEAPVGVLVVAVLGSLWIRHRSNFAAADAVRNELRKCALGHEAEEARKSGFLTHKNMALVTGSFTLFATFSLATWVVAPAKPVQRIFSITDFITPYTIAGLLANLATRFLRVLLAVTADDATDKKVVYDDLFEAQQKFYTEIGSLLKKATIYSLLPYAFGVVKPYLLSAATVFAPGLVTTG